jgi:coenzyme F420-reducing hydrogenase gamma subunit
MKSQSKPRIAFFDFACCEGCQLSVLELEATLLELLEHVEVVAWREVMSTAGDDYDIAFCEGSITRQQDVDRIKQIRATADVVVSLGACASIGCHNALKNKWPMTEALELVYGPDAHYFDTIAARPVTAVVTVDYQVQGCPVSRPEFETVFKHILTGQDYEPPNQPVCVECKLNDNLCVYEKGMVCLGPVTRCGCNAICTTFGDACQGCRGLIDDANLEAAVTVLTAERLHSIMAAVAQKFEFSEEEIRTKFSLYNNWPELQIEDRSTNGK